MIVFQYDLIHCFHCTAIKDNRPWKWYEIVCWWKLKTRKSNKVIICIFTLKNIPMYFYPPLLWYMVSIQNRKHNNIYNIEKKYNVAVVYTVYIIYSTYRGSFYMRRRDVNLYKNNNII